jgi:hypothetical protein
MTAPLSPDKKSEAVRLVYGISEAAADIRADWSDPRESLRLIQEYCDKLREILSAPSETAAITEPMVEAAAQRMVALVMSRVIEKPQLVQWQQWAGAARGILEAVFETQSAPHTCKPDLYFDRNCKPCAADQSLPSATRRTPAHLDTNLEAVGIFIQRDGKWIEIEDRDMDNEADACFLYREVSASE